MTTLDRIEAEGLTCVRGGRLVFRDVTFRVESGQALAVDGPNGSGKTSLLRMIAGLLLAASGTLRLRMGQTDTVAPDERRSFVGWLGSQDAIKPRLTPMETVRFFEALNGTKKRCDAEAVLRTVGLLGAADMPCQYLSTGQKKRLALAQLTLSARPLWLLDEPFATLDADGRALTTAFVREHLACGGIAILAAHDPVGLPCGRLTLA